MTNDITAIYGGTFDPPTNGHYHIIEKAAKIFDKVCIVVASNPDKKNYMFSVEDRVEMLKGMITKINSNSFFHDWSVKISIEVLPENTYLAYFADQKSCGKGILIRGIRDEIDFSYEQKICRTNKLIQPNIETIYIMPDDSYSLVSSSWIKGLIGCKGWRNIIEQNTPPNIALKIKENYLKQKFYKLNSISESNKDYVWEEICKNYKNRKYHGYDHLISMFENYDDFGDQFHHSSMSYAIFLHDIYDSVDECINLSKKVWMTSDVNRLINATRHTTEEYENKDEKFISSIDLLVLASGQDEYDKYLNNVYEEYEKKKAIKTFDDWKKGRSEFLKNMLNRKNIFTFNPIKNRQRYAPEYLNDIEVNGGPNFSNEQIARANMKKELELYSWEN